MYRINYRGGGDLKCKVSLVWGKYGNLTIGKFACSLKQSFYHICDKLLGHCNCLSLAENRR